jgi:hypothetical protein
MTAAQQEPGQLITAAGAFIRATITGGEWTAQRASALVKDAPGGYLYFSFLVARVAGALLVQACGSKAQAAALVNDWVNENVQMRVRKSA